jgi:predicted Zn-dependent peptidase
VSEKDLDAAKDHLIGGIYLASENADNRMIRLAKNEFVFGREVGYEEVVSNLEQVTVDDVIEMANTIFADGRVSLVTLGPLKEEDLDKSCLEFG